VKQLIFPSPKNKRERIIFGVDVDLFLTFPWCVFDLDFGGGTSEKSFSGSAGLERATEKEQGKAPQKTGNHHVAGGALLCPDGGRSKNGRSESQSRTLAAANQSTAERNQRAQARNERAKRAGCQPPPHQHQITNPQFKGTHPAVKSR
jgi:hypothetical protein